MLLNITTFIQICQMIIPTLFVYYFISQPYLTQAIKKVEQELGTAIIIRQSGVLHLTEAGKNLLSIP